MRLRIVSKRAATRQSSPDVGRRYAYRGNSGQTVLAILQEITKLETVPHKQGVFVASINGISGNPGKGWIFTVNGKLTPVAANLLKLRRRDEVEWQFVHLIRRSRAS